jgi:hypothetical protein
MSGLQEFLPYLGVVPKSVLLGKVIKVMAATTMCGGGTIHPTESSHHKG